MAMKHTPHKRNYVKFTDPCYLLYVLLFFFYCLLLYFYSCFLCATFEHSVLSATDHDIQL